MAEEQRIEEKILSRQAERSLYQQLDKADYIDIDVQTDLLKIIQGLMDGVYVSGQGLVVKGIRLQDIKLQTDNIDINPWSALFGRIELNQPINATIRIVLTEADINHALKSDIITGKMPKFRLKVDDASLIFKPQEIQMYLPKDDKMAFTGKVLLQENDESRLLSFSASIRPRTNEKPIILESFQCTEGEGISLETVTSLVKAIKELVNLPYFKFEDMTLRLKKMQVQTGKLVLLLEAQVRQIPSV